MEGYIKLNRSMLDWGWYDNANTKIVFLHLLLTANFREREYHGVVIKAGDAVFGIQALSEKLGISVQQVRTALKHLQSTGEITVKSTNQFSVATLENWAKYQIFDGEATNEQQTSNKRVTPPKERKKEKNNIPPDRDEVARYIKEQNFNVEVERFFDYYDSNGWKVGSSKMKDWKATVRNWNRRATKEIPQERPKYVI